MCFSAEPDSDQRSNDWFRQLDLAPFDDLIWPHLFSAVLGKNSFIPVVVVAVEMW
jgi:hypothetical protein